MRKRWRSQSKNGTDLQDDIPSAMPVNLDSEESLAGEFEEHATDLVDLEADDFHGNAMEQLFGHSSDDTFLNPMRGPAFEETGPRDADGRAVNFVDAGAEDVQLSGSFSHVGKAAPDVIVSEAIRLTDKKAVLFPWEKGRMSRIFGDQGRLEPKLPRLHASSNSFVRVDVEVREGLHCSTAIGVRPTRTDDALYSSVVKQVIGGSYLEERDAKRELAVRAWWDLLRLDMTCSDPGRIALQETGILDMCRSGMETLDASLGVKSPNTVMKRLYAVKTFNTWVIRQSSNHWLPVDEKAVWAYFKALKLEKAPATRATSLLEALRFCFFVFRVDGCEETLSSLRVRGLAAQLYASKRPWRPADPFTVSDVQFLHKAMMDERRSLIDRVFVGHLIHMIYARARFSDLLAAVNCELDEEQMFLELQATVHKGSRTAVTKAMLLPVVAPAHGIVDGCWASDYLTLREKAGLSLPGGEPAPMLPAPVEGGTGWQRRFLTSQEMNAFMQRLFEDGGFSLSGRRLSTHSCKATCISWCAKHDVSPEHREILARHSKVSQGPTALYSRDLITAALRSLVAVLAAIKAQSFFPDRSRSGMITPVPAPPAPMATTPMPSTPMPAATVTQLDEPSGVASQEVESLVPSPESPLLDSPGSWRKVDWHEQAMQEDVPEAVDPPNLLGDWRDNSSDSSYGSDSDSDVEMRWDEGTTVGGSSRVPSNACVKYFINGKTLVIHQRRDESLFKCGRVIGDSYFPVASLSGLRCGKCFADAL